MTLPKTKSKYQKFIDDFENCNIQKDDWHHPEHVAVGFWYLTNFDFDLAIDKTREGIKKLNDSHGIEQTKESGYHETWTLFFLNILNRFISEDTNSQESVMENLSNAVVFLKDFRGVTREYYSRELIMSWEARTSWQDPDLKTLR